MTHHSPLFEPSHSLLHTPVAPKQRTSPGLTALRDPSVSPGLDLKSKPGLQAHPDAPPPWAATQGNFPELTLLFPGHAASGQRSVVRSSDCLLLHSPFRGLPDSLSASIDSCCLLISRLSHTASSSPFIPAPTRLPHSALGPSPWPQEVCLLLFSTSNISILKTHICILMAPVPARQGYTLMHIYILERSAFPCTASDFPL